MLGVARVEEDVEVAPEHKGRNVDLAYILGEVCCLASEVLNQWMTSPARPE